MIWRVNHRITWLDVFAERPLAGNGLAVLDEADPVGDEEMLAVAKEMGLSETTFVQTASEEGADYRNRIFTVERELPFAGHPSLGTAVAVARWRGLDGASFTQQTGAGLQAIEVRQEGSGWRAEMVQNEAELGSEFDPEAAMKSVALAPDDADPELRPQVVSTGLPTAIVPVASAAALARARPDFDAMDELLADAKPRAGETPSFYLVWHERGSGEARARMFSRVVPGGEDPATGSAAGPLGAYLHRHAGCERVVIRQGEEMGRPSVLVVEMVDGRTRVGGDVMPLIDGEISLP
jgi:trans-2,3-dihydro-3-hydroxyanthranilate isomerase